MPDEDPPDDAPRLEMPSFSLRRKKRTAARSGPEGTPEPERVDLEPEPEATPSEPVAQPVEPEAAQPEPEPVEPEAASRGRSPVRLPNLSGLTAALVVGAVVGALAVLLVWVSTGACDAIRGTPSCGGGPGLLILVATLALLAYVGSWLLRAFGVPEPGSTSFLGVGLMAVVALLFFGSALDAWWMALVVPVLAMAGFATSWWVTTRVAASADERADERRLHDVP